MRRSRDGTHFYRLWPFSEDATAMLVGVVVFAAAAWVTRW